MTATGERRRAAKEPMIAERIRVIDTDTHITEPYDLFTSRVSKKWGDMVPHVRTMPWADSGRWGPAYDGSTPSDIWIIGGEPQLPDEQPLGPPIGQLTMAGWREWPPGHPATLEQFDPASYDAAKRLERMDEYGLHAQVIYPNVGGFGNDKFLRLREPALMLECVRAYNDFLAEWCATDPKRLVAICATPFWDLEASLREVERCRGLGHRGVLFAQAPEVHGQPMLADPHWEPLWSLAEELGMSINFHIGSGEPIDVMAGFAGNGPAANLAKGAVNMFIANTKGVMEVLVSGICHRHPDLNFVSVESGVGWIPFLLEALDWQWYGAGAHEEHPEFDLLPSEYFKRQVYGCFWFERGSALAAMQALPDNLMYETDFPHPTSMSPGPASLAQVPKDYIQDVFRDVPEETRRKVLHDNAARVYRLED